MIRFSCECGQQLQGRDEDAGKQSRCPVCGRVSVIPPSEAIATTDEPPQRVEHPRPDAVEPERSARRRRRDDDDYDDEDERPRRRRRAAAAEPPDATSGKATAALVLGIMSFPCGGNIVTGLPAIILGALALRDVGKSDGRLGGKGMATAGLIMGCLGIFMLAPILLLFPAVWKVRQAAERMQDQNNLKQLAIGMHNFHDTNMGFPRAAAFRSPDGKPLLSSRVALLPYIEQDNLYKQFHLDEPWDSPHNKQFLPMIPKTYRLPDQPANSDGLTYYQVFTGPGAIFGDPLMKKKDPPKFPVGPPGSGVPLAGTPISAITDGTFNTILIATARNPVPWTKPEDIPFDPKQPLPPLGAPFRSAGFSVVLADGSVRFIPANTQESILKAAITRNGNEIVTLP